MILRKEFPSIEGVMIPKKENGTRQNYRGYPVIARVVFQGRKGVKKVFEDTEPYIALEFLMKAVPFLAGTLTSGNAVAAEKWQEFHGDDSQELLCTLTSHKSADRVEVVIFNHGLLTPQQMRFIEGELKVHVEAEYLSFPIVNDSDTEFVGGESQIETTEKVSPVIINTELSYESKEKKDVYITDLISGVCKYYCLKEVDVVGQSRVPKLVRARYVIMYLARKNLDLPFKTIGIAFENRDHSSVMHGVKKIEELITDNRENMADDIRHFCSVFDF